MKSKLDRPISISITPGTFIMGIVICILFYFLYVIRDLVMVVLTSVVIASAIEPATRWFSKFKFPRVLSVLIIYLGIASALVGLSAVFVPPLLEDVSSLAASFPEYISALSTASFNDIPGIHTLVESVTNGNLTGDIASKITDTFSGATAGFLAVVSGIFGGLLSFVLIIALSFYFAVQENGVENFIKIVTPEKHEKYVVDLWRRSQRKIGLWMQGQLVLMLLIGILTYLGLSILGVRHAMFLALIAALFELIPVFGPILSAVPAVAFGLLDGGLTLGLLVTGLYLIIQQFENQLIVPLVVQKIIGIPAIVAIVALIAGGTIAGFLGVIISIPIAGGVMEFLGDIEKRKRGELKLEA